MLKNSLLDDLPVPSFQKDYIDGLLKKLESLHLKKRWSYNNIYESAMLRGPNKFDKVYICRLFCLLRNLEF